MRIKLTLEPQDPQHQRVLIHGASNTGKTYLAGSAMKYYLEEGKSVFFVDTVGEEGTRSIVDMGLPVDVAETVDTYKDFQEILKERTAAKTGLLVVDSLKFVWKYIMLDVLKSDRAPVISKTSTDWTDLYRAYDKMLVQLIGAATDLIVLCPSDISMNEVKGELMITPDLPGRKRAETVSSMDMVGYLESDPLGAKTRRVLSFHGRGGITTKMRSRTPVTSSFPIIEGHDAWRGLQEKLNIVV